MAGSRHTLGQTYKARSLCWAAGILVVLAGCQDGGFSLGSGATDSDAAGLPIASAGQTTELVERDIEAPEVFQVSEQGLWDGRPSLGGVWVAHPDVTDPERVIIRNTENGAFVIGALFRSERDNPGPALQVSSDAAEALQMLAGAPAALNVTALRREEAAPEAVSAPSAAVTALTAPDEITASPLDAVPAESVTETPAETSATPVTDVAVALPAPVVIDAPAAAAPAPVGASLSQPFIQIGIFSIEANARGAAADLEGQGLPSRVVAGETQGRAFWRVLVGPAASEAERARYLQQVRASGFADAYAVRN